MILVTKIYVIYKSSILFGRIVKSLETNISILMIKNAQKDLPTLIMIKLRY